MKTSKDVRHNKDAVSRSDARNAKLSIKRLDNKHNKRSRGVVDE